MGIIRKYDIKTFLKSNIVQKLKFNYVEYWDDRYLKGGNSGDGSYGILAEYKAEIINNFINLNNIKSVIEFGCGDGNQLKYMNYIKYIGLDVSNTSIDMCKSIFKNDTSKSFMSYNPNYFVNNGAISSDLVVCLDVLYHIIDENDFIKTLNDIFSCASEYVIIYTSVNRNVFGKTATHVLHRDICSYLKNYPEFEIKNIVENKHKDLTFADFIFLEKIQSE